MNKKIQRNFKKTIMKGLMVLVFGMIGEVSWGQNAIVGSDFGSGWNVACNSNSNFNYMSAGAGTSQTSGNKIPASTGDKYWRLATDYSGTIIQYNQTGNGTDFTVSPNTKYQLSGNCQINGAMKYNVPSTNYRYVFKTRDASSNPTRDWVFFEIQGNLVQTLSSHTSPISANVYPGTSQRLTVTASGTFVTGQSVYIRYHNGLGFSASTISELTYSGTGNNYYFDIPASTNLTGATISYYFFTSGNGLTITSSDADLYTINLLNNGGTNYSYTVSGAWQSIATGNWSSNSTWNANLTPPTNISLGALTIGHNILLNQDAIISSLTISAGTFTTNDGTNRTLTINTGTSNSATAISNSGTWTNGSATTTVAFTGSPASMATIATIGNISFQNLSITSTTTSAYGVTFPGSSTTVSGNLTIGKVGFISSIANTSFWGNSSSLIFDQGSGEIFSVDAGGVTWKTGSEPRPKTVVVNSGTLDIGNSRTVSTSNTTTSLTVNNGAILTVAIGQTLTQTTGGTIAIKSNASGDGSIGNSAGTITGNVNVERYIPAGDRRYRFLSSPINGNLLSDWQQEIYITGAGTGNTFGNTNSNGFDATTTNQNSFYFYKEDSNTTGTLNQRWQKPITTNYQFVKGKGYRVYIRGDRSSIDKLNNVDTNQNAVTIVSTGTVNSGLNTYPVTYSGGGGDNGWNLVGNPYPSSINWNGAGWIKTGVDPVIYIYKPSTNTYGNWDGSTSTLGVTQYISSGQAFWVRTTSSPTFSCTEAVKTSTSGSSIFKTTIEENTLRIALIKNETNKDETVIRFMDGKKDEFSENDDVRKFYNSTVNVSSFFDTATYASVNYLSNELSSDKVVPISAWVDEAGTYMLNFTGIENFNLSKSIFLKDKFLNSITDLSITPNIDFTITSDINSKGDNRFEVVFVAKSSTATKENLMTLSSTNLSVYPNPATDLLNISLSNANFKNSNIVVYNVSGMEVSKSTMNGASAQLNIDGLGSGVYFVKVSNENGFSKTVKFVK